MSQPNPCRRHIHPLCRLYGAGLAILFTWFFVKNFKPDEEMISNPFQVISGFLVLAGLAIAADQPKARWFFYPFALSAIALFGFTAFWTYVMVGMTPGNSGVASGLSFIKLSAGMIVYLIVGSILFGLNFWSPILPSRSIM